MSVLASVSDPSFALGLDKLFSHAPKASADAQVEESTTQAMASAGDLPTFVDILNGYAGILVISFAVTLVSIPVLRRLAIANGVVDRPSDPRKIHRVPIAYMGGVGVYLGILAGIFLSYLAIAFDGIVLFHDTEFDSPVTGLPWPVPVSIVLGITVITVIGLLDDVFGVSPRVKIGGQLFAAAALALENVGVKVAEGILSPTIGALLNKPDLTWTFTFPDPVPLIGTGLEIDVIYWTGTAIIAMFVLGACNASNLIDGLDGLLSGVTAITMLGLLVIAVMMIRDGVAAGPRDSQRIVLIMAVLGGCLGFLPHNFNPATIFLGDCGSLLLGFSTIVVILTLGDTGRTEYVIAGLIVYSVPIIDTALAIIRRKMSGRSMSDPDSDHLHHMLKRALGVKGAVLTLYALSAGFAVLGAMIAGSGARIVYTGALLFASFLMVYATKIARMKAIEEQTRRSMERSALRAEAEANESPDEPGEGESSDAADAAGATVGT